VENETEDVSGHPTVTVPPFIDPQDQPQTSFIFHAQLTWGLEPGPNVNLPFLFLDWVANSAKFIPDFSLLPFDDKKGQVINTPDQVPDDNPEFFQEYYYNHLVLNHGNLTGMVQFRCSVSWNEKSSL
jgi:hypothetical protein